MFARALIVAICGLLVLSATSPSAFGGDKVRQIKVIADKAPDNSSLKSIVQTVTRGCKTNDEKAIALYNYCRLMLYHRAYPNEKGGRIPALKLFNVYGWSLCGGLHTAEAALYREAGWEWRYLSWRSPGHTTVEAKYDGQWHYLDVFLKFWVWKSDPNAAGGRTVASQADIKANPELVTRDLVPDPARKPVYRHKGNEFEVIGDKANWQAPAFLVCGDRPGGVISGVNSNRQSGSPTGWMTIQFDGKYSTDVALGAGQSLELMWSAVEGAKWWGRPRNKPDDVGHGCRDKEYRNCPSSGPVLEPYIDVGGRARNYASGKLVFEPDLSNDAFLAALAAKDNVKWSKGKLVAADPSAPASITVRMASPYPMVLASGSADGAESVEVSNDGGKTFQAVELAKFGQAVQGRYASLVKVGFKELKSLRIEAIVQHNRCALPYLSPGKNTISVSVADAKALGDNKLVVTYVYCPGERSRSYEQLAERGYEAARAHNAKWAEAPTVVQKVFTAGDLPAKFDILVPTPKDKYPVYPRMLFLRREVIAAGSKPMPLPAGAVAAKMGPSDVLKTLPNPFLVGIAKPPKKVVRPTVTRKISLSASHVVDMEGGTHDNHYIKWAAVKRGSPQAKAAWVMLVGGELKDLPAVRDIASAEIAIPLVDSHRKATTVVGVAALKNPFEAGKPYDFKDLGGLLGTVNVPKRPEAGEPVYYKIDVTRWLKDLSAGDAKFHGLAIRCVPKVPVDEGYITRIDMSKDAETYLQLKVYVDKK